jgi:hypothetical protein
MTILDPQGPVVAAEKTILIDSIGIMLAIVLPTIDRSLLLPFGFANPTRVRGICRTGSIPAASSSSFGRSRR